VGEEVVLNAYYTVTEADLGNDALANTVEAEGEHSDPDPDPEDPTEPEPVDPTPIDPAPIPVDEVTTVAVTKIWDDQDNAFNTRQTITVNLLADGEVYETVEIGADGNWSYTFEQLPVHNASDAEIVYTVAEEAVAGYDVAYELTASEATGDAWTITNSLQQYTLTVYYWYETIGGEPAATTYTNTYYYGESYSVTSPTITGYSVDIPVVSGTITGDIAYDVIYTEEDYTLTVYYVYEDGSTAASTHWSVHNIGDHYSVVSPEIEGYVATLTLVSGTMPGHDLVYTVIYVPATVTIEEYGVPLGIGSVDMNVGDCFE